LALVGRRCHLDEPYDQRAGWAARSHHTSVVDAAGAIYVIGGNDGTTRYQDVWASTDGGARAGLV
jgi:hypothetical protein